MTLEHPQLTILSGPDAGRVINLDYLPVTLGRSATNAVRLTERYISREHVRLELTGDGVVCHVLSSSGIRIAEKTYKRRKTVLLDTGDVLHLGAETEILFIAAGADRDDAVAEAEAARLASLEAEAAQQRQREMAEQARRKAKQDQVEAAVPVEDGDEAAAAAAPAKPVSPAEAETARRRARMRKLMIGLGIYLGLIVVAFVVFMAMRGDGHDSGPIPPPQMTEAQIEETFAAKPTRTADSVKEAQALEEARNSYDNRHIDPGAYYKCLAAYKEALAYAGGAEAFDAPRDQDAYVEAMDYLRKKIPPLYATACSNASQERWVAARKEFEGVLKMVPDQMHPVARNVRRYLRYIKKREDAEKAGRRRDRPF